MDGAESALLRRTFGDDGELTMAVLPMDDPSRIYGQSSLLTLVGEDRGWGGSCDFGVARVWRGSKLESFPRGGGRIRCG